ncbi:unnamed protein product [Allacma fusca]|uniref:Cation-transporting P-type ATPase N-terminal domain-containing protein n=1 Tax=Allacma fusca TaxID=39272 RepID=A0A8J2Q549_9HEXA|nr:unnamed protein product [Allacma fusca]
MEKDQSNGARRMSKRVSIVIDENDKIWAPNRRASRISGKLSSAGLTNPAFITDETPMNEVHLGHSVDIRRKSLTYLKKELEIDYHEIPIETLYNRLGSHPFQGLDDSQVKRNLEKYGKNQLTPPKKDPLWLKFVKTLVGGFQLLLWAGSFLSFAAYITQCFQKTDPPSDNLYLGIVLSVLVIVLADLVVGDIVDVKFGDRIPADIRIIESSGFKVDNSSLTGESDPQLRIPECTDENPMETKNLAFFSTNALEGTAKGIVVSVGDNTFIGRIAGLTSGLDSADTPLAREVEHFVKLISAVAVFFGVTFFVVSLVMGYALIDSALFLIGIIVANVPEGLLVTFTVILALTAKRMANKNCLVKQLQAVETLGSTTVICSDKTGTLTQNRMTASHLWYGNSIRSTDISKQTDFSKQDAGWKALSRVACLCSRAKFLADQQNVPLSQRKINGDASESAILRCMEELVENVETFQARHKKVFEIPFNSTNKWQVSIHDMTPVGETQQLLVMKGAPERIINYCTTIAIGDKDYELDEHWKNTFTQVCEELGGKGERVLGFCDRLGLDPYDVDDTGISAIVVKGEDLMEFSTEHLDEVLRNHKEIVFARVSPQQKLVIVEGFQRMGEVVAVTGDGVNDSPALKKADIGIAMDIIPTISLSYEKAEGDIMKRQPRNPRTDKLVTDKLISYSYGQLGVIESFAGFFTYFVVMGQNGFKIHRLLGLQAEWDNSSVNDLVDSYGQEWTYHARKQLEHTCWTAFFCSVVVCQWGNVLISKVRRVSLFQKLFDNWIVFLAIIMETAIACLLTYTPGLNTSISYAPIKIWWWLTALPFCIFIIIYDEGRRYLLRHYKSPWFQKEFYY